MKVALGVGNGKIIKKVEELGVDARISVKVRYKVLRETRLRNIIKRKCSWTGWTSLLHG